MQISVGVKKNVLDFIGDMSPISALPLSLLMGDKQSKSRFFKFLFKCILFESGRMFRPPPPLIGSIRDMSPKKSSTF